MTFRPSIDASGYTSQLAAGVRRVDDFVDQLAGAPLSWWLEIGRSLGVDTQGHTGRSTARAILDATIEDRRIGVAAWYARDAVETAAFIVAEQARGWLPADRRDFAVARSAAESAALALLANSFIPREDATVLCAPFSELGLS